MRTYVYSDPKNKRICIAQGLWGLIDDEVTISSEETAKYVIAYIKKRVEDPQWSVEGNEVGIANGKEYLMMSTRVAAGSYGAGILIEQPTSIVFEDCILLDTPARANKLINAIMRRGKELGWKV